MKESCKNCDTFSKSHFCEMKPQSVSFLDLNKKNIHFKKNQIIFNQGDAPQGLYCISKGAVKLSKTDENGHELLLKIYTPGHVIGYRALFANELYQATAIAHEDTFTCFISDSVIKNTMQQAPSLCLSLLKQMSVDIREYEDRMANVISSSVSQRVAEALLVLKKALPDSKWTRKEIAEWAGTTPETVIRTLAQFEVEGLIEQQGRSIRLQNISVLSEIAQIDNFS